MGPADRRRKVRVPRLQPPRRRDLRDGPELGRDRADCTEHATDPADPAYVWPADVTYAIQQAAQYHMRVMLQAIATPSWANGGGHGTIHPRA